MLSLARAAFSRRWALRKPSPSFRRALPPTPAPLASPLGPTGISGSPRGGQSHRPHHALGCRDRIQRWDPGRRAPRIDHCGCRRQPVVHGNQRQQDRAHDSRWPGHPISAGFAQQCGSLVHRRRTGRQLWFTEGGNLNTVGRITTAGVITEFQLITGDAEPNGIVGGPDGNVWFAERGFNGDSKNRTDHPQWTSHGVQHGDHPRYGASQHRRRIRWKSLVLRRVWRSIGRITTDGVVTEFPGAATARMFGITGGPDGNLWYTDLTWVRSAV